jgi:hypothetical protein
MEMRSAEQAKVKSRAAVEPMGFWPGLQEGTCEDGSTVGVRKGSQSGWDAGALEANVDPSSERTAASNVKELKGNAAVPPSIGSQIKQEHRIVKRPKRQH